MRLKVSRRRFAGRASSNSRRLLSITATFLDNATGWPKRAGELKWVFDPDPAKVEAFRQKFPQVERGSQLLIRFSRIRKFSSSPPQRFLRKEGRWAVRLCGPVNTILPIKLRSLSWPN